ATRLRRGGRLPRREVARTTRHAVDSEDVHRNGGKTFAGNTERTATLSPPSANNRAGARLRRQRTQTGDRTPRPGRSKHPRPRHALRSARSHEVTARVHALAAVRPAPSRYAVDRAPDARATPRGSGRTVATAVPPALAVHPAARQMKT